MIVLITGATSGIGKSCAELFSKKGYKTILIGRRKERLLKLSKKLNQMLLSGSMDLQNTVIQIKEIEKFLEILA